MKAGKFFLLSFMLLSLSIWGKENANESFDALAKLKPRSPEWLTKIVERYANGVPKLIYFYDVEEEEKEIAVKRTVLYENGHTHEETDLAEVEEDSPGYLTWQSKIVPHGMSVRFRETGDIEHISCYDKGLIDGPIKVFFPEGKLQHITHFKQGILHGPIFSYFENGQISSEGRYENGQLKGDFFRYYPSGEKEALVPYKEGKIHGLMIEWHEKGAERARLHYLEGKLHSEGTQPAVLKFDEDHAVREVQHFSFGEPEGNHIKYHSNGRESYLATYRKGKLHGQEKYFNSEGKIIGEGQHIDGKKIGKHWRKHDNGTLAFLALYDKKGVLKEPIRLFDEQGQKIREYFLSAEEKFEGPYREWFPSGQIKIDRFYKNGSFEGEQKEYTQTGKLLSFERYVKGLKEGEWKKWTEEGILCFQGFFKEGNKEGEFKEWYSNGQLKGIKNFKNSLFDGEQKEWYEDGKLALEASFKEGKKDGMCRFWNPKGVLLFEGEYSQDKPVGAHLSFFDQGQKQGVIHYLEGKKEGKHEEFYEDGKLQLVESFKDDLLEGEAKGYFPDGSLAFECKFSKGKPIGIKKEYFRSKGEKKPQIHNLLQYNDKGEFHGEQKSFYGNGILETLLAYEDGVLHGLKAHWDEQGNLVEEANYIRGKIEGRYYAKDSEGKEMILHYKKNRKEGPYVIYYPQTENSNEKIKAVEAFYKNNELHGKAIEYDPSGKMVGFTTYQKGKREGPMQLFHPNEKIAVKVEFKNEKKHGPSVQYFPNGQLFKEVIFVEDQKEGEEKTYFENGNLNSIYRYKEGKLEGLSQHWNESNVLIFEAEYKDGLQHGKFFKYYHDGKPRLQQHFVEGKLEGIKKSYDLEGNVTETEYRNGIKVEKNS